MATTQKALNLIEDLAAKLAMRLPSLAQVKGFDSDQNPTLLVGAAAAGSAGALIKVKPQDWPLAKDVLGLTATIFTPHVIQVCFEANNAAGAAADVNSLAQIASIVMEVALRGTRVEIFSETNGAAVGVADLVDAKKVLTFDPLIEAGMIANQ